MFVGTVLKYVVSIQINFTTNSTCLARNIKEVLIKNLQVVWGIGFLYFSQNVRMRHIRTTFAVTIISIVECTLHIKKYSMLSKHVCL